MILLLFGCASTLDPEDFCREAGFAIAARTQECTGDDALAERRYEAFEAAYTCEAFDPADTGGLVKPEDLYACPLAIRNLPCELVATYGDDLDLWLTASPVCQLLVDER